MALAMYIVMLAITIDHGRSTNAVEPVVFVLVQHGAVHRL